MALSHCPVSPNFLTLGPINSIWKCNRPRSRFFTIVLWWYLKPVSKLFQIVCWKSSSKTAQQNFQILHTNSPWVCVIKVCSNGDTTYIIGEIIAKDNLNIENLMQTFENLQKIFSKHTHSQSENLSSLIMRPLSFVKIIVTLQLQENTPGKRKYLLILELNVKVMCHRLYNFS